MIHIPKSIIKKLLYVGPIIESEGIALDIKDIVESSTSVGAVKTILTRGLQKCTPPEFYFGEKCAMPAGVLIASIATGVNPIVLGRLLSADRSIVRG